MPGMRINQRFLGLEELEDRIALSATPPSVVDVAISSTGWSSEFIDYLETNALGTGGYRIPHGSSQATDLPWDNINQIRIEFSEDVYVDSADLHLSGVNEATFSISDFEYVPEERTAIWTFEDALESDRYVIDLDADGVDPVTNLAGVTLDGDWANGVSTGLSGDGSAGGDFEFSFNVLQGDVLGLGIVEYNSLLSVYGRIGADTADPLYLHTADLDGTGLVESAEWLRVYDHLFETLPSGDPIGLTNDAPTTTGIGPVQILDDTVDEVFSLYDAFDDAETADADLSFAIVGNSDPTLFDSVTINTATGELVINTAAGATGRAEILLEATDEAGQTVVTTETVDVNRQNTPPSLTATATDAGFGAWTIEGWVTDPDDELDPLFVVLDSNYFVERVSVAADGYFSFTTLVGPGQIDLVRLFVKDASSTSNNVWVEIG